MPQASVSRDSLTARNPRAAGNVRARALRRWIRRAIWAVLAAGAVVLAVLAWMPKPIVVEMAPTRRGPLRVTVDEAGKARVRDRYIVSAPLGGDVTRIQLRAGDPVDVGQVLARIVPLESPLLDPRSRALSEARVAFAAAAEQQAKVAVTRAELAEEHARKDAAQARELAAHGTVSPDSLDHAEFEARVRGEELASARFAVQMAAHDAEVARAALRRFAPGAAHEHFEVTSPVRGRVLRVVQQSEGVVQPGQALVEVGDPGALEVVTEVLTADAVRIKPAARATLDGWGGALLTAHVRLVEPSAFTRISALGVEEQRVNVVLDLDAPPAAWSALGDGYRVEAHVVVWEREDALAAPSSALFRRGDGWAAFVASEGRARVRDVELGERAGVEVQVVSGLGAGERVIVHPSDRIVDGVRISGR